jgi:hypothetical protein
MSYFLQSIIGMDSILRGSQLAVSQVVPLTQGLRMIPVTDKLFDEVQAAFPQAGESFPKFEKLSGFVAEWIRSLSENGLVAYIEAEYFGGVGSQAAIAWQHGNIVFGPVHSQDAINRALKLFGVEIGNERDEFDAVGLGLHRFTDEWLTDGAI